MVREFQGYSYVNKIVFFYRLHLALCIASRWHQLRISCILNSALLLSLCHVHKSPWRGLAADFCEEYRVALKQLLSCEDYDGIAKEEQQKQGE